MSSIKDIIEDFVGKLQVAIDGHAVDRARAAVMHAFGGVPPKRGPGRPPKALAPVAVPKAEKTSTTRRKGPPQLCPVPDCKNKAAPIFGMVCSTHKDLPKRLIKKYREARKAKKLGVKSVGTTARKKAPKKRAKRVIKKVPKAVTKRAPKKRAKTIAKKEPKPTMKTAPDSGAVAASREAT